MSELEKRASEFGEIVSTILKQFAQMHLCASNEQEISLGHHDLRVLELLGENGPQKMRAIAEHLGLAVNSTTSLIDNLESKAIVKRSRSTVDRRVVNVELSEQGAQVYQIASRSKRQFHLALLAPLTDAEQHQLLDLFRKIAQLGGQSQSNESPSNIAAALHSHVSS